MEYLDKEILLKTVIKDLLNLQYDSVDEMENEVKHLQDKASDVLEIIRIYDRKDVKLICKQN